MTKKVLFLTNIPAPYRINFFNELGKLVDLTVLFEAKTTPFSDFNYNLDQKLNFTAIFLSDGDIRERKVDWKVLPFLKRGLYDHVVVTNYGYATEAAAIFALKARRIPYEMELDGGVLRNENILARAVKRLLVGGAARYWSTGAQTDRFFETLACRKRSFVIRSRRSMSERLFLTPDKEKTIAKKSLHSIQKIVSGRGALHLKGFDLLIRAAARLPQVGGLHRRRSAPDEWLNSRRKLGSIGYICEYAPKETVQAYYRAADAFVLATRGDVWGLVVNEAMANALPVITTEGCVAGCEMIQNGQNGFLIPCDAWEPIAEHLNALLTNDALREQISNAALNTVRGYTLEAMARAHAALFLQD